MNRALRDELTAEVDGIFAETVRHLPLEAGAPDADRVPALLIGVLRTEDRDAQALRMGRSTSNRSAIVQGGGRLRLDRTEHPGLVIRRGDKIVAVDRPGAPLFEVRAIDDRSHLRLTCELGDAN
jgi:hypothetical protein